MPGALDPCTNPGKYNCHTPASVYFIYDVIAFDALCRPD